MTGKTMAAEVLASELGLDLYRIDPQRGGQQVHRRDREEPAPRLRRGRASGAILLFDEADALFGKRSEVRDSHDRYANIEVSYLLQRMEAYRGLAILTTNLKARSTPRSCGGSLRGALSRSPTQMRARRSGGGLPGGDTAGELDVGKLARLNVAGGNIRNIAMNAAFLAARSAESVSMRHLANAARAEFAKSDKTLSDSDTREWR